jgi:voltage-gated potassium channel
MIKAKFSTSLVNFAFFIQNSKSYTNSKNTIHSLLNNNKNPYKKYLDIFMITLILLSVFILIKEAKKPLHDSWFLLNTYFITIIFFIEYVLRLWTVSSISQTIIRQYRKDQFLKRKVSISLALNKAFGDKVRYITSISAIIDFLAILPFFHQLRLLRLFILFRVFKLFHYTHNKLNFSEIFKRKKFEVVTLFTFTLIILFVSAVLIYVMEANVEASKINTLFDAFYWSLVTLSTVGYGDYYPVTNAGRVVAMLIIISGIGVISFSTSIIVTSFTEQLGEIKENRDITRLSRIDNFYLICGYDHLSENVALQLQKFGEQVVILDSREENIEFAKNNNHIAFELDPANTQSYKKLNIDFEHQVKAILTLQNSDISNVYNALTIRSFEKKTPIISTLIEYNNRQKLQRCGINKIIHTQDILNKFSEKIGKKSDYLIVFGYNKNTKEFIKQKCLENQNLEIFVQNQEEFDKASSKKFNTSLFDLSEHWEDIEDNYEEIKTTIFCALLNDAQNIFLTLSLRSYFKDITIISLATDEQSANKMKIAGATKVLPIVQSASDIIISHIKKEIF